MPATMLTAPALARVVPLILDDETAVPTTWEVRPLGDSSANPASAGTFRVTGNATTDSGVVPWRAVLKRMQVPVEFPELAMQRHPMYWRREAEAYRSGLLDALPGGLRAPRCFAIDEPSSGQLSLWLEDVGALGDSALDERGRRDTVRHLAAFHAAYLTGTPIPGYPWMPICFERQWYEGIVTYLASGLNAVRESARHLVNLVAILDDPEPQLRALEAAPQTLCHHDARAMRMAVQALMDGTSRLDVVSWQFVGRGAVGEDLGQYLSDLLARAPADARERLESEALATYHLALAANGVRMSLAAVHQAYYCAAALRQASVAVLDLSRRLEGADSRDQARSLTEAFVRATRHSHLPVLCARATALA